MVFDSCPGISKLKTPTLEVKICPVCGNKIELFSTDFSVPCDKCGFVAYNNVVSCIQWCKYAKLCVGEEMYNRWMGERAQKNEQDS